MSGLPEQLAAQLAQRHGIRRAVETGTLKGDGARRLSRHFHRVETIELSRRYATRAKIRFALNPRISVRHGDSAHLLRPAIEPTLYWLDGHWSGGATAGIERECPVLDEIRATSPGRDQDCYLIDDARLFLTPPPPPHNPTHWPSFGEIRDVVAEVRPQHEISLVGDVIVVAPSAGVRR